MTPGQDGMRPSERPQTCRQRHRYTDDDQLRDQFTGRRSMQPSKQAIAGVALTTCSLISSPRSYNRSCPQRSSLHASTQTSRQRTSSWSPRLSALSRLSTNLIFALLLAFHVISPVSAVRINFQNCLDESYRNNDPAPLQWVPLYADAVFDIENESHNLRVTVWGNVTGARNQGALPAPGDSYWDDDTKTNGKIVNIPYKDLNRATTLLRQIDFLSYTPYEKNLDFCRDALTNAKCPLGPTFNFTNRYVP